MDAVFSGEYSEIYDLLHQEKPYESEVDLVLSEIKNHSRRIPTKFLDLACGTGRHVLELKRRGFEVYGNDLSAGMIQTAQRRLSAAGFEGVPLTTSPMENLNFSSVGVKVDCVTAFYTALGYLVDPKSLDRLLRNMKSYLEPGGFFFGDFWSGYKMSREFSPSREKHAETSRWMVKRTSQVSSKPRCNALEVQFKFEVTDKISHIKTNFQESHLVRYHYLPDLENIFMAHGFEIVAAKPFFDSSSTIEDAWNFFILARLLP